MNTITIQLQPDTARILLKKAEQDGQTLEHYLERLVEQEAQNGNGTPTDEGEESTERPWRGVLVLPRSRKSLFSNELQLHQLPKRRSFLNMNWHRAVLDDE